MSDVATLNQYGQQQRVQVRFEEVAASGPDHIKTFTIRAVVNNTAYPEGSGRSKKEAKEKAAQKALEALRLLETTEDKSLASGCTSEIRTTITQPNYQCWLNEHSHRTRITFTPVEWTRIGSLTTPQCCRYVAGDKEYPEGYGRTKKEAREEAAKLVFQTLLREETEVTYGNNNTMASHTVPDLSQNLTNLSMSSPGRSDSVSETNFIGMLNNHCQGAKQGIEYVQVEKRGPPHTPVFVYRVVMNKKQYPVGEGGSAKEARQQAAQRAWEALMEEFDWSSQMSSSKSTLSDGEMSSQTPNKKIANQAASTSTSESIIFEDSPQIPSNYSSIQEASPGNTKSKRKLAINFPMELNKSIEDIPNMKTSTPTKAETALNCSRFIQEFELIEPIGRGGFGRVFKARRKLEKKEYAVKIVKSTEKAQREIRTLADLQHENIVRYYTCWIEEMEYKHNGSNSYSTSDSGNSSSAEFLYIQMELCRGNLRLRIDEWNTKGNPDRRQNALRYIHQILLGVEYIHSKKLIHRDLKPLNILFGAAEKVKIGDFGLVTMPNDDDDASLMKRTKCAGSRSYMSPEQKKQSPYDRKVDIFALGLIYFELLWNCFGAERDQLWNEVRNQYFPQHFCEEFSFEFKLIKRMLCCQPEDRPSAQDLTPQLEKCRQILEKEDKAGRGPRSI
ncbi:interferon-induced, double-stranded RNA-activated protein kinase-like [Denticeps clupeoides]|uniref:Uncharacterized protein n=1 Tax=Denticeps clupeoides TaxID=299321 RepID=A0AAY4ECN3_9TELE|nr:interferon-induced, double-stranded RNA-activated protein kinase-like [Denticeps clupeoides]